MYYRNKEYYKRATNTKTPTNSKTFVILLVTVIVLGISLSNISIMHRVDAQMTRLPEAGLLCRRK
jgi:hypothetical protein